MAFNRNPVTLDIPRFAPLRWFAALSLGLAACTAPQPTEDSGDTDIVLPPASPLIGSHHIVNQWDEQSLVDELEVGFLRINFQNARAEKAVKHDDWAEFDAVVQANGDRRILATLYPRDKKGNVDSDAFLAQVTALVERYGEEIEYWQLDNEPAFSSSRWPEGFDHYAELLGDFAEVVRAHDPSGDIVLGGLAGFNYAALSSLEKDLLTAVASHPEASTVDVIDLHHHRFWYEGPTTRQQIEVTRDFIHTHAPALNHSRFLFTENSTYAGAPDGFPAQEAHQQAAFVLTSVLAALSSGAEACAFGVVMDRPRWEGDPALHPFNLNGLYYNPRKDYGDAQELSGPKPAAYAHAVLKVLTHDLEPQDLTWFEAANGVQAVDVGSNATVLWADQATTHSLEREGAVLTLDDMELVDIASMSLSTLQAAGSSQLSVDLSAREPVVIVWE